MSGYTEEALDRHGVPGGGTTRGFIQKPFTPVELLEKVRAMLDRTSRATLAQTETRCCVHCVALPLHDAAGLQASSLLFRRVRVLQCTGLQGVKRVCM